jgi:hypothetical protein
MADYTFALERGDLNLSEFLPLYRQHYGEMKARLEKDGIANIPPFNMRETQYVHAWSAGYLLNYTARYRGAPVGYFNVYLTNDMHNGDLVAQEDAIYMVPDHRKGAGMKLAKFGIADVKARGAKRMIVSAVTDTRSEILARRLGFKPMAVEMVKTL